MVARGTITLDAGSKTLTLRNERINFRTGLVSKNVPLSDSDNTFNFAIFGRGREILLDGFFSGTQAQIEEFLEFFENWLNNSLDLGETGQYYPMHHPSNQVNGSQSFFWNVMMEDFEWSYDLEEPGRINFLMTMKEGSKAGIFAAESGEA